MKESSLQNAIVKILRDRHVCHFKIISAGTSGWPDLVLVIGGKFIGIECKSETGRQSDLQKYREAQIVEAGGEYYVIRETGEIWEIFRAHKKNLTLPPNECILLS